MQDFIRFDFKLILNQCSLVILVLVHLCYSLPAAIAGACRIISLSIIFIMLTFVSEYHTNSGILFE